MSDIRPSSRSSARLFSMTTQTTSSAICIAFANWPSSHRAAVHHDGPIVPSGSAQAHHQRAGPQSEKSACRTRKYAGLAADRAFRRRCPTPARERSVYNAVGGGEFAGDAETCPCINDRRAAEDRACADSMRRELCRRTRAIEPRPFR
jgi:hypothetical protein